MRNKKISLLLLSILLVVVTSSEIAVYAETNPGSRPSDINSFVSNLKKKIAVVDCGTQGIGFFGSYSIPDTYKQNGFNSILVTNKSLTTECINRKRELLLTVGSEHPKSALQSFHGTGVDFVSFRTSHKAEDTLNLYDSYKPEVGWWVMVVTFDNYKGILFNVSKITRIQDDHVFYIDSVSPQPKFMSALVVSSMGNFLGLVTSELFGGLPTNENWKVHGAKLQCSADPGEKTITSCTNYATVWGTRFSSNEPTPTPKPSLSIETDTEIDERLFQEIIVNNYPETITLGSKIVSLDLYSTSDLPVRISSNSGKICKVTAGGIQAVSVGRCEIELSQEGNSDFEPADNVILEIQILASRKSIVCIKGKITKKVSGINPKCPSGYTKK